MEPTPTRSTGARRRQSIGDGSCTNSRETRVRRWLDMDDETALAAVLVPPQLKRFREVCEVAGPIEPRFDGYTKHVLLTDDRAFLFPRNHTIVAQLERECDVYTTVDHPLVPKLLGRWDEPAISPYPFFALPTLSVLPWASAWRHILRAARGPGRRSRRESHAEVKGAETDTQPQT
jgi:hypothetical protein